MSILNRKSFVLASLAAILFSFGAAASAAESAHNLILIIPEALPASGVDQSNAPALARLRREGVSFANSHAGFPRLTRADSFIDASDLKADALLAAATRRYTVGFFPEGSKESELERLVSAMLPQAKARNRPFFIVYQMKEAAGIENTQTVTPVRPAFKPNPRAVDNALERIEGALRTLGLYETTNIVVAAEHSFSRVMKVSNTSRGRSLLPHEDTLGVLSAGFLAIDLIAALQIDYPELQLFDSDADNLVLDWANGSHPKRGNAIIARYDPSIPYLTVEAHGAFDSIFLNGARSKPERRGLARRVLETLQAQDYLGGVFVNEKSVGLFRGALPLHHIALQTETEELPDIVVVFAPARERCAPAEVCTSVIADTPLIEGEGIANPFSRVGTATFMAARGPDFQQALISRAPASNADLNRTIAALLDIDIDSSNARVLRESLSGSRHKPAPLPKLQPLSSTPALDGLVTELHLQFLGSTVYLDSAVASHLEALVSDLERPQRRGWRWPFKTFNITISDDKF